MNQYVYVGQNTKHCPICNFVTIIRCCFWTREMPPRKPSTTPRHSMIFLPTPSAQPTMSYGGKYLQNVTWCLEAKPPVALGMLNTDGFNPQQSEMAKKYDRQNETRSLIEVELRLIVKETSGITPLLSDLSTIRFTVHRSAPAWLVFSVAPWWLKFHLGRLLVDTQFSRMEMESHHVQKGLNGLHPSAIWDHRPHPNRPAKCLFADVAKGSVPLQKGLPLTSQTYAYISWLYGLAKDLNHLEPTSSKWSS